MSSTLNLFNTIDSNGSIKFYEYNSTTGNYDDTTPTSQILFNNTGYISLDVSKDIILDADNGNIILKDADIQFLKFLNLSGDAVIYNGVSDKDIIFKDLGSDNEIIRIDGSTESLLIANNKKIEFSNNSQYITSDGTNLSVVSGGGLNYTSGASSTISMTGNLTMDVSGDIILDANGDNITMKSNNLYPLDFIHSNTGDWTIKNTTQDKDIIFNLNNGGVDTEVMRIDGSLSNIGINTSTPYTKLDILDSSNTQLRLTHTNNTDYIDFRAVSNSNISSLEITSPDATGFIKFSDNNSGSVSSYISSGNNDIIPFLAIGNVSNGNTANTPSDIAYGFKFLYTNSNGNLKIQRNNNNTTSNDIMTFERSTGNIGIGTTSPSSALQVIGEITSSSFTDGTTQIYSGSLNNISYLQSINASFTNLYGNVSNLTGINSKSITDGNTSVICSDTGTGSISFKIDNAELFNLVSNNNSSSRLNFMSPDATGNFTIGIYNDSHVPSGVSFIYAVSNKLSFGAHNTEVMKLFNNSGTKTVCIGTTTSYENYPLTVEGNIISAGNTSALSIVRRDTGTLSWRMYSPQGDFRIYSETGSGALGDALTIQTTTGNVGIGTTNPISKLQVNGGIRGNTITDGVATLKNGVFTGLSNISSNKYTDGSISINNGSLTNLKFINHNKQVNTEKLVVGNYSPTYTTFYNSQNDNSFKTIYNGSSDFYNIPGSNNKTYGSNLTFYIKYTVASDAGNGIGMLYAGSQYKIGIQLDFDNRGLFAPFIDTESPYNDWLFSNYFATFSDNIPNNQSKGGSYEAIVEYDFSTSSQITIKCYFKHDSTNYSWTINDSNFPLMVNSGSNSFSLGSSEYIYLGRQISGNYFKGIINDFKIIEKSLTADERNQLFYNIDINNELSVTINKKLYIDPTNDNIMKFSLVNNQFKLNTPSTISSSKPLLIKAEQDDNTTMGILGAIPYTNSSRTDSNPVFLIDGIYNNYGFGTISFRLTEGGSYNSTAKKRYDIMQNGNHSWYNSVEKELLNIYSSSTNTVLFIGGDNAISSPETERYLRFNQSNAQISATTNTLKFTASNYFYFNSGNVGINTNSPDRKLEILDNTNPQLRLTHTDNTDYIDLKVSTISNIPYFEITSPDATGFIKFNDINSNFICSFIGSGNNSTIPFLGVGNISQQSTDPNTPSDIAYGFKFLYNTSGNLVLQRNNNSTTSNDLITFYRNAGGMFVDGTNNSGNYSNNSGDFILKQRYAGANQYVSNNGGLRFYNPYINKTWAIFTNAANDFNFNFEGSNKSYLNDTGSNIQINNFTGQHRSFINEYTLDELKELEGLIVCANKDNYTLMSGSLTSGITAITTNEALPDISFCSKDNDKTCFGVLSNIEDINKRTDSFGNYTVIYEKEEGDTRPYINSVGEGCIWVSNKNGNFESGDFITTSSIPGYGMKQENDLKCNYTVAKITQDCDFIQTQVYKKEILKEDIQVEETKEIIVKDENGEIIYDTDNSGAKVERKETITETITKKVNVLDSNGFVQFVDTNETEDKYKLRYLLPNGTQITESEYNTKIANNENVYLAVFVGCTYHCG